MIKYIIVLEEGMSIRAVRQCSARRGMLANITHLKTRGAYKEDVREYYSLTSNETREPVCCSILTIGRVASDLAQGV
jgi:hypothetical protein